MTFDTQKYWFSEADKSAAAASSDPRNNPVHGIQSGIDNYFKAVQQQAQQQEMKLGMQKFALQAQEYFSKKELQNKTLEGTSNLAKMMAGFKDMTDPMIPEAIYGELAKSPMLAPIAEQFLDNHRQAIQFKQKKDELEAGRLQRLQDRKTVPMLNLEEADRLETEAAGIEEADPGRATSLRKNSALLRSTVTAPSEVIESYTDANGVQQFRVARGAAADKPAKDFSTPTTATASQIQQRMLAADKTLELGSRLLGTLTESDVGVKGNVNQVLINEGLAQLVPGMKKGGVTEARTLLGTFNENAIKAIASDPRISDKDRKRYEQILPTLGAVESLQSAKDKIKTFMGRFREQARTDAVAASLPIPNWALTITELREKVKAGELSEDDAVKILVKYH